MRNAGAGEAQVFGLGMSPDGSRLFLVGRQRTVVGGQNQDDFLTVAFDLMLGEEAWSAVYAGPSGLDDYALLAAVSPGGDRVFVTGWSCSTDNRDNEPDYTTLAYDAATGGQLWLRRYSGTGYSNVPYGICVAPRGDVAYVTGISWSDASQWDPVTIAYDGLTGNELWNTRLLGGPTQWAWGNALRVAPGGARLYVVGYGQDPGTRYKFLVVSYDSETGAQVWKQEWPSLNNDLGYADALALSPDGTRLYVGGTYFPSQQVSGSLTALVFGPFTTPPTADLQATPASGAAPLEVTFAPTAQDLDGALGEWDLDVDGDGMPDYEGTGAPPPTVTHTYAKAGAFTARLTVGDDHGGAARDTVTITVTGTVAVAMGTPGVSVELGPNVSNPFHERTTIAFRLPEAACVRLTIHDSGGRLVRVLADGSRPAGRHAVTWDGQDERGRWVAAGVYTALLNAGSLTGSRRMTVLR